MPYRILVVDDDISQANLIEKLLADEADFETHSVNGGQEAIDILTKEDSMAKFDVVLLDIAMPDVSGIDVLKAVKPVNSTIPIIIRTGYDDIDMAVDAMKAGADDFIKKFDSPERLRKSIYTAIRRKVNNAETDIVNGSDSAPIVVSESFDNVIGDSAAVKEMIELGRKVAASDIPVLLEGESGCGKELMARAIHASSKRSGKPFIAVNCGAIPENLVESILFGHEKGSFTGALYKTIGKFREAEGGTIFLDEVGELPLDVQVKLLRVLQEGEIDPVGSSKSVNINVRLISATNRNLMDEVKEQNFREDLFYRLNVFPIYVPSLRDRNGDIVKLIDHFIEHFAEAEGKHIDAIDDGAKDLLCGYEWPGNIRQLKNTIFRAVVLCETGHLQVEDFPQIVSAINSGMENLSAAGYNKINIHENNGDFRKLSEIEKDVIISALEHYNGHMSEVARKLGIGRSTLYRKLDEFNIHSDGIHDEQVN